MKKKTTFKKWGLSLLLMGSTSLTVAQINTPTPTVPFGSNTSYEYGILPTNLPSSGTYGSSTDAATQYDSWKATYVEACTGGSYRVRFENASETVSEGIAYGMLIAAYVADKDLFDGLWKYYKDNSNGNGVMNWKIAGCTNNAVGDNGASDAEVDAAMALLVAEKQWPDINSPYDYGQEATTLINAVKATEMHPTSHQLVNGDGWGFSNSCRNPSYQSPAYYKAYTEHTGDNYWLNDAVPAAYTLINNNVNTTTGLISNWSDPTGAPNNCNGPNEYGYDACRSPWRMATDVIWWNDADATEICNDLASFVASKDASTIGGPVAQNGSGTGVHNAVFVSTYASGLVGGNNQVALNEMYTETKNLPQDMYFGETLKTIMMFMMTGNFWNPYSNNLGGNCAKPDLGSDQSICGVSSILLDANVPTTNRTFTWEHNGSAISGDQVTNEIMLPGTYIVEVDSGNGECVLSDEIVISGTLPAVDLGPTIDLCTPSVALLDAGVTGAGLNFEWKNTGVTLSETGSTLEVTTAGNYSLTITASRCEPQSGNVTITSSLPEISAGTFCAPGSATLEVLSTDGPYEWYSSETSTTPIVTDNIFTTPTLNSATTYYLKDAGSFDVTVGLDAANNTLSTEAGRDGNSQEMVLLFDALTTFDLNALTVIYYSFNCSGTTSITINIRDENDNLVGSSSGTVPCDGQGPSTGRLVLDDPINVPEGTGYSMNIVGSDRNVSWYQNGASYPYGTPDVISFRGPSTSISQWAPNSHPAFFGLELSTGNNCDRVPVTAVEDCVTGTSEKSVMEQLTIYPNPALEQLNIVTSANLIKLEVLDFSGRFVKTSTKSSVDVSDLEKGSYLISIQTDEGQTTRKFVKR